jgi:PAS domain S-box-containing protein
MGTSRKKPAEPKRGHASHRAEAVSADMPPMSEVQCRALVDAVDVGITLIDADFNIVTGNRKQAEIVGRDPREYVGNKCYRMFEDRDDVCPHCPGIKAMATGTSNEVESLGTRSDGSWFAVRLTASPVCDTDGRAIGFVEVVEDIREKKRAEEKLGETEQRYRQLFEVESDAILMLDREKGCFIDANKAASTLYGYTREEFFHLHAEDISAEPDKTRAAIAGGETAIHLRWHRKKDGTVFPVEIATSYFDSRGRRLLVAAIRDIADRRQAEEALRLNEQRLRLALLGSGGGVWDMDLATGEAWWSNEMFTLWGVEPGTSMGLDNSLALLHEQDRDRVIDTVRKAAADHTDYRCEFRIRHSTLGERWMASLGRAIYDPSGNPVRMIGLTLDATDRKQAQQALLESEDRFRMLVEDTRDVVMRILPDGTSAYCSPTVTAFGGYIAEEEIGQPLQKYLADPRQTERVLAVLAEAIETRQGRCVEFLYRPKSGEPFWVEVSGKAVVENDEVTAIHCIMRDITDRKRAEEDLQAANARLEQALAHAEALSESLPEPNVIGKLFVTNFFGFPHQSDSLRASPSPEEIPS